VDSTRDVVVIRTDVVVIRTLPQTGATIENRCGIETGNLEVIGGATGDHAIDRTGHDVRDPEYGAGAITRRVE